MAGQTVQVSVLADTRRFSRDMRGMGGELGKLGRDLQRVGGRFKSAGRNLTRWITAPAVGAAAAVGGIVAAFGWGRLKAVDSAQAQLRGLGHSAEDVERITAGLAEALEGGMMTMAEATFAAAGAMAAGVEEGKELTRYIQILDSAVVGGTGTFQEMNQIFARVTDQGKLTRTEFDMIAQRMPGFSSAVQDAMGVGSEAMYQMLRDGEITTADFLDVMEDFAGDMATEYASSWEGLVANTKAWVGIIGETLLGGVFESSKESLAEFQEYLKSDDVQQWAADAGEAIGDAFSRIVDKIRDAIDWWKELDDAQKDMIVTTGAIVVALGPVLTLMGTTLSILGRLTQAVGGLKAALAALTAPLTLKIALVAAVVGALGYFFTQTETGQAIVENVWNKIKEVTETVVTWFKDDALPVLQGVWDQIVQAAKDALGWYQEHVEPVLVAIGELFRAIWEEIIQPALQDLQEGWEELWTRVQEVWEEYGAPIKETIETAFENLKDALATTWENIKTIVETALAVIKNIIEAVTAAIRGDWEGAWESIKEAASAAWEGIKTVVTNSLESVRRQIDRVLGLIRSLWNQAWDRIRDALQNAWTSIRTTVANALNTVRATISGALGTISHMWNAAWTAVGTVLRNAWTGIRTAVTDGIRNVVSTIRDLPRRAREALGNIGSTLINAGRDLIQGFIDGITGGFQRVRDKLSELTSFLPDWKGPASRDRQILKDAGQLVIAGFVDGLESQYGTVRRSLAGLTRDVASTRFEPLEAPEAAPSPGRAALGNAPGQIRPGQHPTAPSPVDLSTRSIEDLASELARVIDHHARTRGLQAVGATQAAQGMALAGI